MLPLWVLVPVGAAGVKLAYDYLYPASEPVPRTVPSTRRTVATSTLGPSIGDPNYDLGDHDEGDPFGSFRDYQLPTKAQREAVAAGRVILGILTLGTSEAVVALIGSGGLGDKVLWIDPKYPRALDAMQAATFADTGSGVGTELYGGSDEDEDYKGHPVHRSYSGPKSAIEATGRALYGDLSDAVKAGAYIGSVNGKPTLRYRTTPWVTT